METGVGFELGFDGGKDLAAGALDLFRVDGCVVELCEDGVAFFPAVARVVPSRCI